MTVAAIIQCTPGDLVGSLDPGDYCVEECLKARFFDQVVIACPDGPGFEKLENAASTWGVKFYKGSNMNVAARLLGAARSVQATIIVRVLLRQFYIDIEQVGRMVAQLQKSEADYVVLPPDYNYALAADVGRVDAFSRAVEQIDAIEDDRVRSSMHFSPWVFVEERPEDFKLTEIDGGAAYGPEKVAKIRQKYARLISENQTHFQWNYPASSYGFMGKYLNKSDVVLDIACGKGQGVRRLKEYCCEAVGVDLTPEHVEIARNENSHVEGIRYEVGDAETFVQDRYFDAIVSLHTLEHLNDPGAFFECSVKNLKKGGRLLLEVPLLLKHPLNKPLMPWHHKEYALQELIDLVKKYDFHVKEVWAKKRHAFVEISLNNGLAVGAHGRLTAGIIIATKR